MTSKAQQIKLDNALVAPENRRVIDKCNMRINPGMKPKEPTYQVVLDALALITCYHAFLITAEIDNKRFYVNVEVFRDNLNICPRMQGQEFDEPPTKEEALSFIRELGHSREIKYIADVIVDHLHQLWRTFPSIINKCLCVKVFVLDKIQLSRVQILWGMYYKKNIDFVALIWVDLDYHIDNKDSKKQDKMFYPRFTKMIFHHFLEKDKSISMRNRMSMYTARDDSLLGTMRFVSKHEDAQIYGAILPKAMTNQVMLDSVAYKTYYAIASGDEPLKSKKPKTKSESVISSEETPSKKKLPKLKKIGKDLNVLLEVALSEAAQLKEATKRSKKDFHISQESGSGDGTDFESGVTDEQQYKTSGADEGTGTKPGVLDVPKYLSKSEIKSWEDSDDDESNDDNSDTVTKDDDEDDVESDDNDDNEAKEEKEKDNVHTPDSFEFNDDDEEYDELYNDVNVRSKVAKHEKDGKGDPEMTDTTHETLKQSSSVSSDFASKFLNLDNVPPVIDEVASMMNVKTPHEESSTQAPPLLTVPMTTPTPVPTTKPMTSSIPDLLDFASLFGFDQRVSALEQDLSQNTINESLENVVLAKSSSQPQSTYEAATSLAKFELKKILLDKLEKSKLYQVAEQYKDLYDALVKFYQLDKDLFDSYGKSYSLKRVREDKDKVEDPLVGSDQGLKKRKTSKDAEASRGSKSKESKSSLSKGSKSQSKSPGKSA
ncbi:hypothetical protein Tco_0661705 [Tanacetum coccineum]